MSDAQKAKEDAKKAKEEAKKAKSGAAPPAGSDAAAENVTTSNTTAVSNLRPWGPDSSVSDAR